MTKHHIHPLYGLIVLTTLAGCVDPPFLSQAVITVQGDGSKYTNFLKVDISQLPPEAKVVKTPKYTHKFRHPYRTTVEIFPTVPVKIIVVPDTDEPYTPPK